MALDALRIFAGSLAAITSLYAQPATPLPSPCHARHGLRRQVGVRLRQSAVAYLCGRAMTPRPAPAQPFEAPSWHMPGPWVLRMILVAVCAMVLAGAGAAWHVSQVSGQEAMRRVVAQQTDEVEVIARLLASKMAQSQ